MRGFQEVMHRIQTCESLLTNTTENVTPKQRERIFGLLAGLRWTLGAPESTAREYAQNYYQHETTTTNKETNKNDE